MSTYSYASSRSVCPLTGLKVKFPGIYSSPKKNNLNVQLCNESIRKVSIQDYINTISSSKLLKNYLFNLDIDTVVTFSFDGKKKNDMINSPSKSIQLKSSPVKSSPVESSPLNILDSDCNSIDTVKLESPIKSPYKNRNQDDLQMKFKIGMIDGKKVLVKLNGSTNLRNSVIKLY